jgi:hypothetical protein
MNENEINNEAITSVVENLTESTEEANEESGVNFHSLVKDYVKANVGSVKSTIIKLYADKELKKMEDATVKAITDLDTAKKELRKLEEPTEFIYDVNGKKISSGFKKEAIELIKKQKEKVIKLETAIKNALVNSDYDKILKL